MKATLKKKKKAKRKNKKKKSDIPKSLRDALAGLPPNQEI